MYMEDWKKRLDAFLEFNEEEILHDTGKVSHAVAVAFAEKEYSKYVKKRDAEYVSDFDQLLLESGEIIPTKKQ